jgi:pyruvate kinase
MLDSMIASPTPTRAEASDVATAIYDGADAVMLSAESATGEYPIETVQMMDRIIRATEGHKLYGAIVRASQPIIEQTSPHAVAAAAADLAEAIAAPVIVAYTSSGTTAGRIARKRPSLPILAITPSQTVARRLRLLWGVHSVQSDSAVGYDEMIAHAASTALTEEFAERGNNIVVVFGVPFGRAGTTNNLRVVQIEG